MSRPCADRAARRPEAQHTKGKLTARERIEPLLDEGSVNEVEQLRRHGAKLPYAYCAAGRGLVDDVGVERDSSIAVGANRERSQSRLAVISATLSWGRKIAGFQGTTLLVGHGTVNEISS